MWTNGLQDSKVWVKTMVLDTIKRYQCNTTLILRYSPDIVGSKVDRRKKHSKTRNIVVFLNSVPTLPKTELYYYY